MSEINIIDAAVEAVIGLMNALTPFATVTRGALPTGNGITCEVTTSAPSETYLNKGALIPLDLTLNGKHTNLATLSETMNHIHDELTKTLTANTYPSGTKWKIVDIYTNNYPSVIGREDSNAWIMASSIIVHLQRKGV